MGSCVWKQLNHKAIEEAFSVAGNKAFLLMVVVVVKLFRLFRFSVCLKRLI